MAIVFLTTSHNQSGDIQNTYERIGNLDTKDIYLVIVESGDTSHHFSGAFASHTSVINMPCTSWWSESVAAGLDYIFKTFDYTSLEKVIIHNSDVNVIEGLPKLIASSWDGKSLITFNTYIEGILANGPFSLGTYRDFFLNKHASRCIVKQDAQNTEGSEWDMTPTRLIVIQGPAIEKLKDIRPRFRTLPHYCADHLFTWDLGKALGEKWHLSTTITLDESILTTGLKIGRPGRSIRSLIFSRRSALNVRDRMLFAILISREISLHKRAGYLFIYTLVLISQIITTSFQVISSNKSVEE